MQTPDKKKQMFHDMQEHPEKYSEEQIETMMDDLDRLPDVDTAWQKFRRTEQSFSRRWLKAAASIIGILMLTGIAYAAVHIWSLTPNPSPKGEGNRYAQVSDTTRQSSTLHLEGSEEATPVIFENTPLDEMVSEIAHYYNKVADIQSEEAHELRLYYKWEPKDSLESVVDDLNHFDRVSLAIEDDKLIVKP